MPTTDNTEDELWSYVKPEYPNRNSIDQMNAKLMACSPAFDRTRREDHSIVRECANIFAGDISISELFRRTPEN